MNFEDLERLVAERTLELTQVIANLNSEISRLKTPADECQVTSDRLAFHIENCPLAFIEWDKQGHAKSWSKRAEEIFEWTSAEIIGSGTTLLALVHEADLAQASIEIENLLSRSVSRNHILLRNIRKDRKILWCEWFNSVMIDDHGEVVTIMSLVKDITERKKVDDLKEYEQREKEALINATDDMMWSVSSDFKLRAINKAFIKGIEALVGVTFKPGDEALISAFPKEMLAFWKEAYIRGFAGEVLKKEVHVAPSGQFAESWSETSFDPIYLDEEVIAVACHSRDITIRKINERENERQAAELLLANKELAFQIKEKEKKAAELIIANRELAFQNEEKEKRAAELFIANNELAFQNEEKEKRAAELLVANKELLAFTYVSSHDLQEPLRKIQTLASRLLESENQNLSETGKNYFRLLQVSAKQMQILIVDLLGFSHLNSAVRQFESTDLNTIIDEVKLEFKETLDEKGGRIDSEGLCCVNVIPFQFRQLMINLIGNSIKYSAPGTPLVVTIQARIENQTQLQIKDLHPGKDYCHISITDNGIGFEPEFSNRIFEVFQKLHGKEEYEGSGIGLAIVKKIVENHNGLITATSQLNAGATFDIYIPLHT